MKITGWVRNCKNQQNICGKKTGQKTGHCKSGKTFSSGLSQETLVPIVDFLFSENPVRSVWRRNQFWESTQALDSGVYMFIKKSSLGRAVFLAALVSFLSLGFISCQPETEIQYVEKEVEKLVEKEVEKLVDKEVYVPVFVYYLTENDPICGEFTASWGGLALKAEPDFAYAMCASGTRVQEAGENVATVTGYTGPEYYKRDSAIYVVYNKFDDSDAADIHSGVIIFKANTSDYGFPKAGCYYGVKFQFLTEGKKVPEKRTKATVYTNDLLIEGGSNSNDVLTYDGYAASSYSEGGYNTVTDLATAVEMFAFDNTAYFSNDSWNLESSGATRKVE